MLYIYILKIYTEIMKILILFGFELLPLRKQNETGGNKLQFSWEFFLTKYSTLIFVKIIKISMKIKWTVIIVTA